MTRTPKYALSIKISGNCTASKMAWSCRDAGRPTDRNLAKWVEGFEASTRPGGCNAHLRPTVVWSAVVTRNNGSNEVVAEYKNSFVIA